MCIEVTDEAEPTFHHALTVGETDFAELKADQALIVDFAAFPDMFIQLLKLCVDSRRTGEGR